MSDVTSSGVGTARRFLAAVQWDPDEVLLFEPVRGLSVHAGAVAVDAAAILVVPVVEAIVLGHGCRPWGMHGHKRRPRVAHAGRVS